MLVHLTYCSRVAPTLSIDDLLHDIREQSKAYNTPRAITGCLVYADGMFFQTIEGHADNVNELYKKILDDKRHFSVRLVHYHQIQKRFFKDFMHVIDVSSSYKHVLLRYSENGHIRAEEFFSPAILCFINEAYIISKLQKDEIYINEDCRAPCRK